MQAAEPSLVWSLTLVFIVATCGGSVGSPSSGGPDATMDTSPPSASDGGSLGEDGRSRFVEAGDGAGNGSEPDGSLDSGGSTSGDGTCKYTCSGIGAGFICCQGSCRNGQNDPTNCGGCGVACGPGTYCNGSCQPLACDAGTTCDAGTSCCGTSCCSPGQFCCLYGGGGPPAPFPPPDPHYCLTPTASEPTCLPGCPLCTSDRNLKRDVEPVDVQAVLESVARLPVSTWSYKDDDPFVRHMGPMAQDFYAAFGLGNTDRAYNAIDAHGVTLAAIQALYERLEQQNARIEGLERENRDLRETRSREKRQLP
jgi:hypothetical protein